MPPGVFQRGHSWHSGQDNSSCLTWIWPACRTFGILGSCPPKPEVLSIALTTKSHQALFQMLARKVGLPLMRVTAELLVNMFGY